jgi:hypothetical protein
MAAKLPVVARLGELLRGGDHCPDGDCGGRAMSGWTVCMAVLGVVTVLVLLLVALFGPRRRTPARPGVEVAGARRAPPLRIMSSTAVLRI